MGNKEKQTAIDIVIDSFLKRVDEEGCMPWQNPHNFGVSINWVSKKMYRGINRVILPSGEYMTAKQLNDYNEKHNEDFKFQKGIHWFPVVFYTKRDVKIKDPENYADLGLQDGDVMPVLGQGVIKCINGVLYKESFILRYSRVAEIRHFKNSKGETLPRRISSNADDNPELFLTKEEPQKVIDDYIERSGVIYDEFDDGQSYYMSVKDLVHVNETYKSVDAKYSTIFHELAHSTGHHSRLARDGILKPYSTNSEGYAIEECIAEITSALLCQETGVSTFVTSGTESYDNSASYVRAWKQRIKDWGKRFVSICKQAESAYLYVLGDDEESQVTGNSSVER